MKRRQIVRIQVAVLILLMILVLGRSCAGEGDPDGVVVLTRIEAHELEEAAFHVDRSVELHISATGSVESRSAASDEPLAAYGWILNSDTREPVWVMSRDGAERGSGMLVHQDTILILGPGTYETYFAGFGSTISSSGGRSFLSRIFDERSHWVNDAGDWSLIVRATADNQDHVSSVSIDELRERPSSVLWQSGPMGNRDTREALMTIAQPIEVSVYSVGEISDEVDDYGWIRSEPDGREVWQLSMDNTSHAGGVDLNRVHRGELTLRPGIHAFGFRTDASHSYEKWRANPPFDPSGWGLRVHYLNPEDSAHVAPFDPWEEFEPTVSLAPVGNDERRAAGFDVEEPTTVVAYALGEIGRSRYDYGLLKSVSADSVVWEMTADRAGHGGGDENNRYEIAFLNLAPGSYELEYRTDGSHAFGDWRKNEPHHPERWGVTLFTLGDGALSNVQIHEALESDVVSAPAPPPTPAQATSGTELVRMTGIGNERRESRSFELERTSDVHIRAVGELTLSNRYDYGWIENQETGQTVWEMTYDNTTHAGGANRNRMFDGVVKLPPGRYVAHFLTDFSHAYDDFPSDAESPTDPEAWGIIIRPQP